ncbi:MAG TPA: TorF family putative porin, partial [Xanthobacteraceae bacterium]|nr:TorF family putative porin [Xanthobacteraceae bacterium]
MPDLRANHLGVSMGNLGFKTLLGAGMLALAISSQARAADLPAKAIAAAPAKAPDFDIAFGGGIMSDYIFRGITQSNHNVSPTAYFEPRYKEFYIGIAGSGIDWPGDASHGLNSPSAEVDLYGGWRPVVGKWTFDLGYIYYLYPNSLQTNALGATFNSDFYELYAKATYAVTDALAVGGAVYWTPNILNYGDSADYWEVNAKYTLPSSYFAKNWGAYVSGAYGYWHVSKDDIPTIPSYATWNAGIGFTWKAFTLDLRYSDTDMDKGDCMNFWFTTGTGVSGWCRASFAAKLS